MVLHHEGKLWPSMHAFLSIVSLIIVPFPWLTAHARAIPAQNNYKKVNLHIE